jgi:putative SOS response-associated peptidase YedK
MKHEDRELLPAKWGLVQFGSKDGKRAGAQINARAETVASRPAYRNAWGGRRRCIVPADGFYEWTGPKDARKPLWFDRPDGGLLLFAGLYESWQPAPGTWERTFTIITTRANEVMAPVHDRMPVILNNEAAEEWLFQGNPPGSVEHLLMPIGDDYLAVAWASTRVNSVKNDDPMCLEVG